MRIHEHDIAEAFIELIDASVWIARVWFLATFVPWRCYPAYIRQRGHARAIGFAIVVVCVWFLVRLLSGTLWYPVIGGFERVSILVWAFFTVAIITPLGLIVLAAMTTLGLTVFAPAKADIDRTLQFIGFAMSPAVLMAIPFEAIQGAVAVYGCLIVIFALVRVHAISFELAVFIGLLPAYLLYGIGFGGADALGSLLQAAYII